MDTVLVVVVYFLLLNVYIHSHTLYQRQIQYKFNTRHIGLYATFNTS